LPIAALAWEEVFDAFCNQELIVMGFEMHIGATLIATRQPEPWEGNGTQQHDLGPLLGAQQ